MFVEDLWPVPGNKCDPVNYGPAILIGPIMRFPDINSHFDSDVDAFWAE